MIRAGEAAEASPAGAAWQPRPHCGPQGLGVEKKSKIESKKVKKINKTNTWLPHCVPSWSRVPHPQPQQGEP